MARYAIPAMLLPKPDEDKDEDKTASGVAHVIKGKGSIVNIGSVAGLRGGTPHLLYPTSKGAVVNMTRAMAAQHGRSGIRVNCVCPGSCPFLDFLFLRSVGLLPYSSLPLLISIFPAETR